MPLRVVPAPLVLAVIMAMAMAMIVPAVSPRGVCMLTRRDTLVLRHARSGVGETVRSRRLAGILRGRGKVMVRDGRRPDGLF